jgi:hypothetical protein
MDASRYKNMNRWDVSVFSIIFNEFKVLNLKFSHLLPKNSKIYSYSRKKLNKKSNWKRITFLIAHETAWEFSHIYF